MSYSSAILYGDIDAKGAATNYYFQYGTTNAYGAQIAALPGGQRDELGQGQPGDHGPAADDASTTTGWWRSARRGRR